MSSKFFVLDTNVLLHNSDAITCFADNTVVLPMTVIEELDKFKKNNDELGRNARRVIRTLDGLRGQGSLGRGVPTADGGTVLITMEREESGGTCIDLDIPDNRIIATAFRLLGEGKRVIFVSKDINARLKADALGIEVQDFEREKADFEQLYTGLRRLPVDGATIDRFHHDKTLHLDAGGLQPNEFVLLVDTTNERHTAVGRAVAASELHTLNPAYESAYNLHPRSLEQRVALELTMREMGAEGPSFPTIVAFGTNAARPHAVPTDRELQAGDLVLIDMGLVLRGYCSDLSRTFVAGRPDPTYIDRHRVVRAAMLAGIGAIRAGVTGAAVDRAARQVIADAGYGDCFGHSLGHGVGLAVHEAPRLSRANRKKLRAGMVVTVEPGIYLPDWGGIRLENMVVVGEDGCELLNHDTTGLDL